MKCLTCNRDVSTEKTDHRCRCGHYVLPKGWLAESVARAVKSRQISDAVQKALPGTTDLAAFSIAEMLANLSGELRIATADYGDFIIKPATGQDMKNKPTRVINISSEVALRDLES